MTETSSQPKDVLEVLEGPSPEKEGHELNVLDRAIQRAQDYLLRMQYPEGFWWGELESNVAITSEYLLLTHFLGVADKARWAKIVTYLQRQQLSNGGWSIYYGDSGNLSMSVEAYFAMKLAGVSPQEPCMQKAREFILSRGGVPKARNFTKIWLALFGQWDWRGTPTMPPEFILLPPSFPINIYEFSSWARGTIVPMLILLTDKPTCPIPPWASIDELYPQSRSQTRYTFGKVTRPLSWGTFFRGCNSLLRGWEKIPWKPGRQWAMKKVERWIVEHQEADGSWGGIQPPWVYSLLALKHLGYPADHPVIAKGLQGFETFAIEDEEIFYTQACLSPTWDTALAMIALLDSGLPPDHPALFKAAFWLLKEQIVVGGDWQVKNKAGEPGGWAFEFENDIYPDTDDAAEILIAIKRVKMLLKGEDQKRALDRGFRWLVSMQSKNGGWGSFDVDNTKRFVTQIPFCDFGEVIDPPSVDVTAHIIEFFGMTGYDRRFASIARALEYIKGEQEEDGSWFGRWGVNYIYGTGAALPALQAVGEDMSQGYIRKAVKWLLEHQNPDGGWGESCDSYANPNLKGKGPSTASQTAWALIGLLATGEEGNPAVQRGIDYLIETQREGGSWDEPHFTGTGFPRDFLINYHMYRNHFPLSALGRYKAALNKG